MVARFSSLPLIFPLVVSSYPSYSPRLRRFFLRRFSRFAPRYFAVRAFSYLSTVHLHIAVSKQVGEVTRDVYVFISFRLSAV